MEEMKADSRRQKIGSSLLDQADRHANAKMSRARGPRFGRFRSASDGDDVRSGEKQKQKQKQKLKKLRYTQTPRLRLLLPAATRTMDRTSRIPEDQEKIVPYTDTNDTSTNAKQLS